MTSLNCFRGMRKLCATKVRISWSGQLKNLGVNVFLSSHLCDATVD